MKGQAPEFDEFQAILKNSDPQIQNYIKELEAINLKLQRKQAQLRAEIATLKNQCTVLEDTINTMKTEAEKNPNIEIDFEGIPSDLLRQLVNAIDAIKSFQKT